MAKPLTGFDLGAPVQVSHPGPEQLGDSIVSYVPRPDDAAIEMLRSLARQGNLTIFTPVPGRVRDALAMPAVAVETVPDRLLADFPRIVAGL